MTPEAVATETVRAWEVAVLYGATSATITGSEAAAREYADSLTAQTRTVWNAVPAGRPGQF
jgi:hypothetical protein